MEIILVLLGVLSGRRVEIILVLLGEINASELLHTDKPPLLCHTTLPFLSLHHRGNFLGES